MTSENTDRADAAAHAEHRYPLVGDELNHRAVEVERRGFIEGAVWGQQQERNRMMPALMDALDGLEEWQLQWGNDYLAEKWGLAEYTDRARAALAEGEGRGE